MRVILENYHLAASSEPKKSLVAAFVCKKRYIYATLFKRPCISLSVCVCTRAAAAVTGHCNETPSPALIIHTAPINWPADCSRP